MPRIAQFESWYPAHRDDFTNISIVVCNVTLQNYQIAFAGPANTSNLNSYCNSHGACIIANIPGNWQANLNGATVILGLMPTLLATIGPSVTEISLLSAHRPLLAFFISMGAPAIYQNRILEYNDPIEVIRGGQGKLVLNLRNAHLAILLSAGQYILAIGSVISVITTSIQVRGNSILSWGCTTTFTPILWTTLVCVIHFVAAISYVIACQVVGRQRSQKRSATGLLSAETGDRELEITLAINNGMHGTSPLSPWLTLPARMWKSVAIICANRPKSCFNVEQIKLPQLAIFLNVFAGYFGFVHIAFGIITFSALQFVGMLMSGERID